MNYSNKSLRDMKATNIIINDKGETQCIYHSTAVVTKRLDGCFVLNSGGYNTVTTKRRMNQFTPYGCCVSQKDYKWFVNGVEFFDGMLLSPGGELMNGTGKDFG